MTDAGHPAPNDHSASNQQSRVSGDVSVSGKIVVEASPKESLARDAAEKKQDAKDKKKWWLEVTTLVIVTVYALLTAWVGCSSQQAAVTASKNLADFEAVEAAQISIEFAPTVKMGKPGQGLLVNGTIDVTNIGQTTAVNFTAMGFSWEQNLAPPEAGKPSFVNGSSNITPFNVAGILLGSGKTQHFPVGFQVSQVDEIRQNTYQSGIWVDFSYSDIFGKRYLGRDCFMVDPSNITEFIRCPNNQFHH